MIGLAAKTNAHLRPITHAHHAIHPNALLSASGQMTTPVGGGHETAASSRLTGRADEIPRQDASRAMLTRLQASDSMSPTSDTSNSPRSPPPPPANNPPTQRRNHSHSYSSTAPAAAGSAQTSPVKSNAARQPTPAKRVPGSSAQDELRSAVTRDALREEAKKASATYHPSHPGVQRNVSAPILTAGSPISPPMSPTMISANSSAVGRGDPRDIMPRNPSIDSTVSSASNTSISRTNGTGAYRVSQESSGPQDVAALIAEAGSPEGAIQKLINDKNQAASHNAQLWRLVEKQRTMILGLNKDLEKALKEKEKYRKKLKDHMGPSESLSSIPTAKKQSEEQEASRSPVVPENAATEPTAPASVRARDISLDSRKASDTSDVPSSGVARSETPLDASNAPSSNLPATPQSATSTIPPAREIEIVEAASAAAQENRIAGPSPTMVSRPDFSHSPKLPSGLHGKSNSISSTSSNPGSFSSPKNQISRRAPPAPLKLSSQKEAEAAAKVTNNIIDPSDSEYEEDPGSARIDQAGRGRRKTREDDDREREVVAQQELEHRSQSKKDKKSKSTQPSEVVEQASEPSAHQPAIVEMTHDQVVKTPMYQQHIDPVNIIRQKAVADAPSALPKSATAPSLLSPGLPMSPRPGDRPMNSPMPRAPNKILNSMPMSPKSGMAGLPLSPRAPRQPIPMPPQTPLAFASPHLARAEGYQTTQPLTSSLPKEIKASPTGTPEQETPMEGPPMTPGEVYQGLVTDEYPDLLLPPNALPSIYVKTASSRMKPSRQSYVAAKSVDDNPYFTLAVHERSDNRQLWRVEKTFAALAQLDELIRASSNFRERLPDKTLFHGHAPAKIDARRTAIDLYFQRMLDSVTDDRPAMVACKFLSTDAIAANTGDYFNVSVDLRPDTPLSKKPRREGYLTKRGKNFGGWKARYFVLEGPVLRYFDSQGGAQLGSIKLQNAQIGKQSNNGQASQEDEDNQFRHAFLILEPKKKDSTSLVRHVLCAESDAERDFWVDALLQYVDYKEDPEEVAARSTSLNVVRGDNGLPRSPRLQKSLNDLRPPSRSRDAPEPQSESIRAIGYADTVPGEAPMVGPPSPMKADASSPLDSNFGPAVEHANPTPSTSSHPNISGPTNMQVISNAGGWGMKPPPTPHNKEHNKDSKKRSFFHGFRGRSSSDLGPNDKPYSSGSPVHEQPNTGTFRAVFGAPLADAVEYARPADVNTELPAVVYRCVEYLMAKNAVAEEGIFRLSGSNTVIKGLKDRFNTEGDVNLLGEGKYHDIHAVASLLKLYLRELPASILTRELHLEFLSCLERPGREKVVALNALVNKLPTANFALLDTLTSMLLSIVNNAEVNKMNVRNVGIVFAPTLNVPAPLISSFVEDQSAIFGPPMDQAYHSVPAQQIPAPASVPTELRSPRKQMFSDLPTPAYNQTTFQSLGVLQNEDTGMIPLHPQYASYQVAPQGEGGFGSLNDALKSPTVYNTVASGVPSSRDAKAKRRESALVGYGVGVGVPKKSSLSQLHEEATKF